MGVVRIPKNFDTGALLKAVYAARDKGDEKEASRLLRSLPMAPRTAALLKEMWGAEELKNGGYNLSAAEAAYGKDWLEK